MVSLPARPLSSPAGHIHHEIRSATSPVHLSEELNSEEATYQNTLPDFYNQRPNGKYWVNLFIKSWPESFMLFTALFLGDNHGIGNAEEQGDYDVLPIRKSMTLILL